MITYGIYRKLGSSGKNKMKRQVVYAKNLLKGMERNARNKHHKRNREESSEFKNWAKDNPQSEMQRGIKNAKKPN